MALSDVSNILWRERQLLELLVFKLEEEQLVLAAGRSRWLAYATREVENVLGEIKRVELERAVLVADAGASSVCRARRRCASSSGLTATPWDGIFVEHRRALLDARAGDRRDHEVEPRAACSAVIRPRAKRSRRWARSTSTRTTRTARCPIVRSRCGSSTRRSDVASFSVGLRLALSALQAQQRSVDVAAQNVANANTPGYSRQAVNLVNIGAPARRRATRRSRATARASRSTRSRAFATSSWRSRPRSSTGRWRASTRPRRR